MIPIGTRYVENQGKGQGLKWMRNQVETENAGGTVSNYCFCYNITVV